jgi:hypothetical protein
VTVDLRIVGRFVAGEVTPQKDSHDRQDDETKDQKQPNARVVPPAQMGT